MMVVLCLGCSKRPSQTSWQTDNGKLKVVSTVAMIHDLVQEIGGDYIDSCALIKGELDPHSYELVKGDDEKFLRADLIFYNGLGLEHGLSLRKHLQDNPKAIAVTSAILKEDPSQILISEGQYDPHVWMDIALWMKIIDPIVEACSSKDPQHAEEYRKRGESLLEKMKSADERAFQKLQAIPQEKRYLVTSHDAFNYFTRHYLAVPGESNWEARCEAPEGLAPDAQLSLSDIIDIISHISKYQISVLFPESNVSKDSLRKILNASREKGFNLRLASDSLYGDSMGNASSYLEMINHNIDVISEELNK